MIPSLPTRHSSRASLRFSSARTRRRDPSNNALNYSATSSITRSKSEIIFNGTPIQLVSAHTPSPKPRPYCPQPSSPPHSPTTSASESPPTSPQLLSPHMQLPPPPSLPLPSPFEQEPFQLPETPHMPLSVHEQQLLADDASSSSFSEQNVAAPLPHNFFIHNGYRYDGDIFELRPPQERSIGSRPERILEHKPLLLSNRQTFTRVYSEGTYNARPSSLRQPVARSRNNKHAIQPIQLDAQDASPKPCKKVTRPPSVRPPPRSHDVPNTSAADLVDCIAAARENASVNGDAKLKGLLAFSAVPVTRQSGNPPPPSFLPTPCTAPAPPIAMKVENETVMNDENANALPCLDKRGRSYTSFARIAACGNGDNADDGREAASAVLKSHKAHKHKNWKHGGAQGVIGGWFREKEKEREKRPSFWKLLTR